MKFFLLAGLGGFFGSMLRVGIGLLFSGSSWATILVNLTGAFVIGFFIKYAESFSDPSFIKAFLVLGLCGGFTTFSAFSMELMKWLDCGKWLIGVGFALVNVVGSLLLVYVGVRVGSLTVGS
jgi:CrcB protein